MPASFVKSGSTPRDALCAAASRFGGACNVAVLHSKRCALLELPTAEAAEAMVDHHGASPLVLGGKPAVVTVEAEGSWVWTAWDESCALALTDDDRVAKECTACLNKLLMELEERERKENAARRRAEHERHLDVMNEVFSHQRFDRLLCWRFHRHPTGGCDYVCCQRSHATGATHFCCAPPSQREFTERDTFPAEHREAAAEKARVNAAIVALAEAHRVSSRACVVLDGAGARSVRALRAAGRVAAEIAVPNTCTQTYDALRRGGECAPFLGSLRALIDSRSCPHASHAQGVDWQVGWGVVYADYCCSLYAGRTDVEKSPVHDLVALFRPGDGTPDAPAASVVADRCVLAVTLARPDTDRPRFPSEVAAAVAAVVAPTAIDAAAVGEGDVPDEAERWRDELREACEGAEDDAGVLGVAVTTLASRAGWDASPGPEAFDYAGTFVRLWTLTRR